MKLKKTKDFQKLTRVKAIPRPGNQIFPSKYRSTPNCAQLSTANVTCLWDDVAFVLRGYGSGNREKNHLGAKKNPPG